MIDLVTAPHEENNLVDTPEHTVTMEALDAQIERIMITTDDDWRREGEFPPPDFVTHETGAEIHTDILQKSAIEVP